jgi:hypothetical protein
MTREGSRVCSCYLLPYLRLVLKKRRIQFISNGLDVHGYGHGSWYIMVQISIYATVFTKFHVGVVRVAYIPLFVAFVAEGRMTLGATGRF